MTLLDLARMTEESTRPQREAAAALAVKRKEDAAVDYCVQKCQEAEGLRVEVFKKNYPSIIVSGW